MRLWLSTVEQLEFPNTWRTRGRKNVKSNVLCFDAREEIDLFVSNRGAGVDRFPVRAIHDLDRIFLHGLPGHQPFHGQSAIKTNGLGEH